MAPRQTNFSAGELDPKLHGRTDIPTFPKGLRTCRNFFITKPHGSAVSRAGTLLVREAKKAVVRLVPFVFSDEQTYCLEFGEEYIRFHTGGETLVFVAGSYPAGAAGEPFEVATEYSEEDLPRLRWAQSGDVLFITCPGKVPYKLSRFDHVRWQLEVLSLTPPSPRFMDLTVSPPVQLAKPRLLLPLPAGDETHPQREWRWAWTCIMQEKTTGKLVESLPFFIINVYDEGDEATHIPISSNHGHVLYGDGKAITVKLASAPLGNAWEYIPGDWQGNAELDDAWEVAQALADANPSDFDLQVAAHNAKVAADIEKAKAYAIVAYNIYRGRGDLFGFVGQTKTREFVDVGEVPIYTHPPPYGFNPFYTRDQAGVVVGIEKPAAVTLFQDKLVLAGTELRPEWVFTSASGDYYNFDTIPIDVAGKALQLQLGSGQREGVRHLVSVGRMVALTDSSALSVAGQQGDPLDFDSIDIWRICGVGATELQPLIVDGAVVYARTKGLGAMALVPSAERGGYSPRDVSRAAQHLFIGKTRGDFLTPAIGAAAVLERKLADWCHAEDPWGIVWACRKDGVLLSLTLDVDSNIWGWARHDTDGNVLALCAVPEGEEDAVYMAVERTVAGLSHTFIERMASRVRRGSVEDDCAVDAAVRFDIEATETTITGLEHLRGRKVWVVATGNYPIERTVSDAGEVTLEDPLLENVPEVRDGLDLVTPAHVVGFVGLKFTPELETLGVVTDDTRTKQKITKAVYLEVEQSIGLYTGQDFDHLKPWKNKQVSHGYTLSPAATELVEVFAKGAWDKDARAAVRQTLPLPVTVLGITREVDIGGS